ncbi:MAG: hypothetical protein HYZ69_02600, partial [Candidatus Colwellbacteria bacterium]|nr:hypothetical protein [Candidatus Colwellbacteria bacterium]
MKGFTIVLALVLVVSFSLPASASAVTNPGVKPGSFFYFFDTTFEKVGLFFTFNPEKKARKALEYADERLAEAEAVAGDNNTEAVKTAITNYESNIAFASEKSKEVREKEKAEALLTTITDSTSKHQEILTDVLSKVSNEAKEVITKAIEANRKEHEEAMQKTVELKGEVEKLKQEVSELKAKDEERERVIRELSRQKTKTIPVQTSTLTPVKQTTPTQISEAQPTPKPSITQTQTPTKTTSIVTLPNGAIVETDRSGNIVRTIKEASINTATQIFEELAKRNELLEEQNKILQQQAQAIQQIQQNTTSPPPPPPAPTVTLSLDKYRTPEGIYIVDDGKLPFVWSSTSADKCTGYGQDYESGYVSRGIWDPQKWGWAGDKATSGTQTIIAKESGEFRFWLGCENSSSSKQSEQVTIRIRQLSPPPPPPPSLSVIKMTHPNSQLYNDENLLIYFQVVNSYSFPIEVSSFTLDISESVLEGGNLSLSSFSAIISPSNCFCAVANDTQTFNFPDILLDNSLT